MKKIMPLVVALVWSFSFSSIVTSGQAPSQLTAEFDRLISSEFKGQEPGGVVQITQKGKIIYKKAFGLANLRETGRSNIIGLELSNKRGVSKTVLKRTDKAIPVVP